MATCEPFDTSSNAYLSSNVSVNVTFGESVSYDCNVPGRDPATFIQTCMYDFTDNSYKMMGDIIECIGKCVISGDFRKNTKQIRYMKISQYIKNKYITVADLAPSSTTSVWLELMVLLAGRQLSLLYIIIKISISNPYVDHEVDGIAYLSIITCL